MSAAEFEGAGHAAVEQCLNTILASSSQAEAHRAIIKMLDALSGDGKIAKQARRGASVALADVIQRGLAAIKLDGEVAQ